MDTEIIFWIVAVICAALLSFAVTPAVRVLSFKLGTVDDPSKQKERRMHSIPIPRIGGLAIFLAFTVTTLAFCEITPTLISVWVGGAVLVLLGIIDDKLNLSPWIKLLVQVGAALFAVSQGLTIEFISIGGSYITFGGWAIPITVLWIVGLTNAVNLIDGLDGLACGVSAICSVSLFVVTLLLRGPSAEALITAVLAGSCLGFLPFNINPAKIFMGDTGALFLGYALSLLSISGVFKVHALLSFIIPLSIFGLPLFDTVFAFFRRIFHGKSPFSSDRGHIHHRLIDMGFGHKQSVRILYAICAILGISSVLLTRADLYPAAVIIAAAVILFVVTYFILKNKTTREQSGLTNSDTPDRVQIHPEKPDGENENKENGGPEKP